eukprot:2078145-Rhodomonas_salina.1
MTPHFSLPHQVTGGKAIRLEEGRKEAVARAPLPCPPSHSTALFTANPNTIPTPTAPRTTQLLQNYPGRASSLSCLFVSRASLRFSSVSSVLKRLFGSRASLRFQSVSSVRALRPSYSAGVVSASAASTNSTSASAIVRDGTSLGSWPRKPGVRV